jgi:hypothetical protein
MPKKLQKITLQQNISNKVETLIGEANSLYEATWDGWIKLGNKIKQLDSELKKDNYASLPSVEKKLSFSWLHASKILRVAESDLLKNKKIRNRLPQTIGTLQVLSGMPKKDITDALVANIKVKDDDGKRISVPLIRPDMVRKELEDWRKVKNQTTLVGVKKPKGKKQINLKITYSENLNDKTLEKKYAQLEKITDKDFKIELQELGNLLK